MAGYVGTKAVLLSTTAANVGGAASVGAGLTVDNDGSTVLTVDRATSDGTVIDVQKSGSSVGSIGNRDADDIFINTAGGTGSLSVGGTQYYAWSSGAIYPWTDNASNLGASSNRWDDLYLSGGVYLGGTGAANKISDYETGTWTPVIRGSGGDPSVTYTTANTGGIYTKVGDTVFVSFEVRWSAITGGSGNVSISGLPFTRSSTNNPDGDRSTFDFYNVTVPSGGVAPIVNAGTGQAVLNLSFTRSGTTTTSLPVSNLINTNPGFIRASLFYKV